MPHPDDLLARDDQDPSRAFDLCETSQDADGSERIDSAPQEDVVEAAPSGGSGYSWRRPSEATTMWWWGLPEETRVALAALRPGDAMCPASAQAVAAAGLPCPRIPSRIGGRRVVRLVATASLIQTIHFVRMTHSERRLA